MALVRLKSIKIFGFKSFAEETEIYFSKRFTAIVGPNGSGKSNIVDAFRWVFGDQSYRMLRISEAIDLIHQSERRKINFTSVKVTLLVNEEEFVIERKINRKGDVIYLKNGQEVRLKDIIEFLAKLKVGVKGLTVINQGMSDLFLRASPKERYEILSEMFGTKFLEIKMKEALNNLEDAQKRYQGLEREVAKIKPTLELYQKEQEKLAKKQVLEEKLTKLQKECKEIEKYHLLQQKESLSQTIQTLQEKVEQLDNQLQTLSQIKQDFPEEKLSELQKRKIELLEKREQRTKELTHHRKKKNILFELKEGLSAILQLHSITEIHQKVKELLNLFEEKTEEKSEEKSEEKAIDPELEEEIQKITQEIAKEEASIKEKKKIYQEKMQEISKKERELVRYQYEKQIKEKALAEIENQLQAFADITAQEGDLAKIQSEFEQTKEELWRLGSIHEGILQEGKKVKEKYEKVIQEIEDVNKSLKELQERINHYDKEIRTTFKMYLDRINLDLEKYFQEFFGSGELRLVFKEGEVHLQFKHSVKKLRTLEGLSGGERALVSIILIFALTQISDPPFLILDEIDAPLDENNAQKFVQLIKNLSYRTQFIVITHNRVTMEKSEAIFGVSMNQEGVSKVFSLKLKQAEKIAK